MIIPLVVLQLVLLFFAIRDWMRQPDTMPNKMVWLVIIIVVATLGAVMYFLIAPRVGKDDQWLNG